MQIMVKGMTYHCRFCHKSYIFMDEKLTCHEADCCHIGDIEMTREQLVKENNKRLKSMGMK